MKHLISIVGPTAVGKTRLSLAVAKHFGAEILSTDARQMYQQMDIGTAKATPEELALVPHHFINDLSPTETINAGQFEQLATQELEQQFTKREVVVSVGGSTLYINALWNGIDPMPEISPEIRSDLQAAWKQHGLAPLLAELAEVDPLTHERIDQQNPVRVIRALEVYRASGKPISFFRKGKQPKKRDYQLWKIGLQEERSALYARINQRVLAMLDQGLVQEVEGLLEKGYAPSLQSMQSIGYREIVQYLQGAISLERAIELIQRNSRRYAKRQMTWFRRETDIQWFPAGATQEVVDWLKHAM